jgi:hypothetical protein
MNMDIATELERSRLLGTTRPTDEEIKEAFGVLRDKSEASCTTCVDAFSAAEDLSDCTSKESVDALSRLLSACGFSSSMSRGAAEKFIATIKAAK